MNKTISDRRAIAVYALLTRQPPLWEDLYAHAVDGDAWGTRAIQLMLQTIVGRANDDSGNPLPPNSPYYAGAIDGAYGPETTNAVKALQTDSGLAVDGDAGPRTRMVLFGAYMDAVCTSPPSDGPAASGANANDPSSSPTPTSFRMQPTDFLGGASAGPGDLPKMSLQGCSRFNPIVLLTSDEMNGDDQATRNADDAPNRRVLVFFFAKGTTLDAGNWPCPKVKETCDACKSAFWSDADQRRANGDGRREYKTTQNTMACRFYDRFARRSPCEGMARTLRVRLFDKYCNPMDSVGYEATIGPETHAGTAAASYAIIPAVVTPATVHLRWSPVQDQSTGQTHYEYEMDVYVDFTVDDANEVAARKLHNLGYSADALADNVRSFQRDSGLQQTGKLEDAQDELNRRHDLAVPRDSRA